MIGLSRINYARASKRICCPLLSFVGNRTCNNVVISASANMKHFSTDRNDRVLGVPRVSRIDAHVSRNRIKSAYGYVGGGLALTALSATAFYDLGLPELLLSASPQLLLGIGITTQLSLLFATMTTDYDINPHRKKALWAGFMIFNGAALSVIGGIGGTIVLQAGLATAFMVGGLSIGAMRAKANCMAEVEGPLGAGLGVVAAASLSCVFWPLPMLHAVSLYGGLLVFSALTVSDTQDLVDEAEMFPNFDPINSSLGVYMNTLNIFLRMAQLLRSPLSKN